MTKPVIVTRAGKGSALSFVEGDANFTNLQNATVTVAGDSGTPQVLDLNDTLTISGGTGLTSVASATDTVTLNLDNTAVTPASYTYASITVDQQGRLTAASSGTAPLVAGGALGTPSSGTLTNCTFPTLNQNTTGSAATLTTPRAINGVAFDGSAAITVTAAASTLSGSTLASGVTSSSLTALGTIVTGVWNGTSISTTYTDAKVTSVNGSTGAVTGLATTASLSSYQATSEKNQANGYVGLDGSSKIASTYLPSYVDDVEEYAALANFPATGETGKIYVTTGTNKTYRWSGSAYVEISASPGSTDSVTEGATNLYFTTQRARDSFSQSTGITITSGAVAIANTAVTPAAYTYASITVDAQGRITAAANGTAPLTSGGALGTPSSATLTNATGLPISTGVSGLGSGVATFLATPSSANLISAVTDETGTGALVFATSPTLVTPALGTPSSGTLTNCTFPTLNQNTSGSAATLTTGRTVAITGDLTYTSGTFDGSGNVTGVGTLANTAVTPASYTYASITVDSKGRITAASSGTAPLTSGGALGTPSSGTLTNCTADGTNAVGYRNIPAVGTKTTSYTLVVGDVGKYVQVGSGGSITIPNSTFAEGDAIVIANNHTAAITITCTITDAYIGGTDTDKATVSLATRGVCNILFVSGTRCIITGNVS